MRGKSEANWSSRECFVDFTFAAVPVNNKTETCLQKRRRGDFGQFLTPLASAFSVATKTKSGERNLFSGPFDNRVARLSRTFKDRSHFKNSHKRGALKDDIR